MKKTWRSLLSVTLIASMLLSMLLVSGLTFTTSAAIIPAEADPVVWGEVSVSNTHTELFNASTLTHTGTNDWLITALEDTRGGAYARVTLNNIDTHPFLVVAVDPKTTTVNAYTFMGQSNMMTVAGQYNYITAPTAAVGSEIGATFLAKPQMTIVDLRNMPGNAGATSYTFYIMLDAHVGDTFGINAMYQLPASSAPVHDLPLANFDPAYRSQTTSFAAAGRQGKGFATNGVYTADPQWGMLGYGYTAFHVTTAEASRRPYLVLQVKDDHASSVEIYITEYNKFFATNLYTWKFATDNARALDMSAYTATGYTVYIKHKNNTPTEVTQAYLTAAPEYAEKESYEADVVVLNSIAAVAPSNVSYFVYGATTTGLSAVAADAATGKLCIPFTKEQIAKTPYLVLQRAPDSQFAHLRVTATDPESGVAAAATDYVVTTEHTSIVKINLAAINDGNTVWLYGETAGQSQGIVNLTQLYLTAMPGFAKDLETAGDVLLSGQSAAISGTVGAYGSSGAGLSVNPPATVGDSCYYVYDIPAASVTNTPFLVLQADPRFASMLTESYLFYNDATQGEQKLADFRLDGSVQVIPLRKYDRLNTRTLRVRLVSTGAIKFNLAYLTASPNLAVAANGVESSKIIVAEQTPSAYKVNRDVHKLDKAGFALVANGEMADGYYSYYTFDKATIDAHPYLIYKSRGAGNYYRYGVVDGTRWSGGKYYALTADDQLHVVDLRTLSTYSTTMTHMSLVFCLELVNDADPMLFDCLIMANTPDFDYNTIAVDANSTYIVHYEERGGDVDLADSYIKKDQLITATNTKEGYIFNGWYIIDNNQKVDAPAVTADMTVYAKYAIAGEFAGKTSPVYAQLQNGVTGDSDTAKIRFVMAIKKAQLYEYDEVGFIISTKDATPEEGEAGCIVSSTDTVYTSIVADGMRVTAQQLGGDYICALTLTNIKNTNFGSNIYVRTVAKKDGVVQYMSNVRTYTVDGMLIGQV